MYTHKSVLCLVLIHSAFSRRIVTEESEGRLVFVLFRTYQDLVIASKPPRLYPRSCPRLGVDHITRLHQAGLLPAAFEVMLQTSANTQLPHPRSSWNSLHDLRIEKDTDLFSLTPCQVLFQTLTNDLMSPSEQLTEPNPAIASCDGKH